MREIDLTSYGWPAPRWHEALKSLAREAEFLSHLPDLPGLSGYQGAVDDNIIDQWMTAATQKIGIESESVALPYAGLEESVQRIGPALIRLPGGDTPCFLAVLKGGKQWVKVIAPDRTVRRISPKRLRDVLVHDLEAPLIPAIQTLLSDAGIPDERQAVAKTAILHEQLNSAYIGGNWLLRLSPGDDFLKQIRHARLPRHLSIILGASLTAQLFMLLQWLLIGRGALEGHLEWAWISAWALLLFTAIPLQLLNTWAQNILSLGLGRLLKQRLLHGILLLEPEEIRHQGSGQFLGLVMETSSLESLALGGGLTAVIAAFELFIIAGVLAIGAGGLLHTLLLLGWTAFACLLCRYYYRYADEWMAFYRKLTNDLVERMTGHRTRLAQEALADWHKEEDQFLARYMQYSEKVDSIKTLIKGIVERGWLIIGFSGIFYSFIVAPAVSTAFAISLGGILLALQSLNRFVTGASNVVEVMIAWKQLRPLFHAAARRQKQTPFHFVSPEDIQENQAREPVLSARNLTFSYQRGAPPILQACCLEIHKGERLLLEGPSGSGKSTLSALLSGLRVPESGQLSLWGFNQQMLGLQAWRKKIVTAPQFHENHILTETFAFNLLMGRRWPPLPEDLEEAKMICRELGLGDLLERMPAGFQQMIGESGWQLSHGERSRLYIARALLQQADLIILDESFAALDPENLRLALQCVLRRAPTILVIAHP
ncbi:MAG: ABC transporter ATP-binding protein [Gammaproteobacteria bacterium]|nr:ABC transporter ATP-binding protein [Gammaproteobacteria bacterium]